MKTPDTMTKGTPEVLVPFNTDGGVVESSFGGSLLSYQQDITQTEVSSILAGVRQALPPEELTGAKNQALEFQVRMKLFVQEVERVKKGFEYRYDGGDGKEYILGLSVSDEVFEGIFERILMENKKLRESYVNILSGFSGDKTKLKKRIMKKYGEDLVYEGMKKGENSEVLMEGLDIKGKDINGIKDAVVGFVKSGGRGLYFDYNKLDELFLGNPELFKDMVVEFAELGGKWLNIGSNCRDKIFIGEPELFKEMVVEFAKNGGKGLDLYRNELDELFLGNPELFKDMVVEFAEFGGRRLDLRSNGLDKLFIGKPKLFKDMLVEFAKNGGKMLDLGDNCLGAIFAEEPELFKEMVVEFARNGGNSLNIGSNALNELFTSKPKIFKEMVVEFAKSGGRGLDLGGNGPKKLFVCDPELFKEMVVEFAKNGGKGLNLGGYCLYEVFVGKPKLLKKMVVEFAEAGGKFLDLGQLFNILTEKPEFTGSGGKFLDSLYSGLNRLFRGTINTRNWLLFTKNETIRDTIEETCKTYGIVINYYG